MSNSRYTHLCRKHDCFTFWNTMERAFTCGCSEGPEAFNPEDHDWPQKRDYTGKCAVCDTMFRGSKETVQRKTCFRCWISNDFGMKPASKQPDKPKEPDAAQMTESFQKELDALCLRYAENWPVPISIMVGVLMFKAHTMMDRTIRQSESE